MKNNLDNLAIFGGPPLVGLTLPVGQINMPEWEKFEALANGIFDRRYYSNHGVLAQELESNLCQFMSVSHAVTMVNATVGLSVACKAIDLKPGDKVIVPAFTFAATVQALTWCGLEPVFCDVNPNTHNISAETVIHLLDTPGVKAILGVHLWGNPCDIVNLEELARDRRMFLLYDAAHSVGCEYNGKNAATYGVCSVFSFHATKIINSTEGGCVTTNNDEVAERLRNIRASYGRRSTVPIPVIANGRFSEMQAAFALLSLEDFPKNRADNERRMRLYVENLKDISGIRFLLPTRGVCHNYQYVVIEIDEKDFGLSRDELVRILKAENIHARRYFMPGMHRSVPYKTQYPQYVNTLPVTDALCNKVMQVPSGQCVTDSDIQNICCLIRYIKTHSEEIKKRIACNSISL